jgi:hypothetical protein
MLATEPFTSFKVSSMPSRKTGHVRLAFGEHSENPGG